MLDGVSQTAAAKHILLLFTVFESSCNAPSCSPGQGMHGTDCRNDQLSRSLLHARLQERALRNLNKYKRRKGTPEQLAAWLHHHPEAQSPHESIICSIFQYPGHLKNWTLHVESINPSALVCLQTGAVRAGLTSTKVCNRRNHRASDTAGDATPEAEWRWHRPRAATSASPALTASAVASRVDAEWLSVR